MRLMKSRLLWCGGRRFLDTKNLSKKMGLPVLHKNWAGIVLGIEKETSHYSH